MSYFISNRTRVSLQFNYYWSRNCSSSVYVSSFGWTVALKHELWCASYKLSIFLEVQFSFLRSILAIWKCRCIVVSKEVHFCRVRLTPLCHPLFISFHFVHVDGSVSCFLTVHSCVQEVTQLAQRCAAIGGLQCCCCGSSGEPHASNFVHLNCQVCAC
jgi:hypothetical protein